jgi:hypothetical protein
MGNGSVFIVDESNLAEESTIQSRAVSGEPSAGGSVLILGTRDSVKYVFDEIGEFLNGQSVPHLGIAPQARHGLPGNDGDHRGDGWAYSSRKRFSLR